MLSLMFGQDQRDVCSTDQLDDLRGKLRAVIVCSVTSVLDICSDKI